MSADALIGLSGDFSPRYELVREDVVLIDVSGLDRIIGAPQEIARELARTADARGLHLQIALAATRTAATLLALHDEGPVCVIVGPGEETAAVARLPLSLLAALPPDPHVATASASTSARGTNGASVAAVERVPSPPAPSPKREGVNNDDSFSPGRGQKPASDQTLTSGLKAAHDPKPTRAPYGKTRGARGRGSSTNYRLAPAPAAGRETTVALVDTLLRWGLRTLGDVMRLPAADLFERLGAATFWLRRVAAGQDARPLVPTMAEEAFEAELALEWPLDTLEPLAFVLGRLLDPLCLRLEQRDRGAVAVIVSLRLVSRRIDTRRLELPAPMRDAKVLRTLILLDLESHPPDAGIDIVTIRFDVSPGRIVQHSLLTRATPTPEQLSTLIARLSAVMGDGRVGAPALLDTHRPEAFELRRFNPPPGLIAIADSASGSGSGADSASAEMAPAATAPPRTLRRFRRPLPVGVRLEEGRPVFLDSDVPGVRGGRIVLAAGPWQSSGAWWPVPPGTAGAFMRAWDREEWDVRLREGDVCRIYYDRLRKHWMLESILD